MSFLTLLLPLHASAHAVTLAYIDLRPAQHGEPMQMTVAIHPHQALLLLGLPHKDADGEDADFSGQIPDLKDRADLLGAYLSGHVSISANGKPCTWEPTSVDIPGTELAALADGISMTAPLLCEGEPQALEVESTIFVDAFPDQQTVVRFEMPDGFAERLLLDVKIQKGTVDISLPTIQKTEPPPAPSVRAPNPYVQWVGWGIVALIAAAAAIVGYRMNIASPKE